MIHGLLGPTQAHLSVTQINSTRFYLIRIVELIMCLEYLKNEILKIRSLKIENFEMNLKFENFELGFWKFGFEIKNLNFIKLRFGNL